MVRGGGGVDWATENPGPASLSTIVSLDSCYRGVWLVPLSEIGGSLRPKVAKS